MYTRVIFILLFPIILTISAHLLPPEQGLRNLPKVEVDHIENGTIWAFLVAGSNGYYNYRHQADVCHSYQVLREHGIPDDRIVVMMYDDIANNTENPSPGVIINRPGGRNVYAGVPKDYTGDQVSPAMFLRVLQGDPDLVAQGRKVIASGARDHVFVYFADHGAPGLLAFPEGELKATTLNSVFQKMHRQRTYRRLVMYVEACESGSMFEHLLADHLGIFATTAANGRESSYACFWDDYRGTYLADAYSANWLMDSDIRPSLDGETLSEQFQLVRKETNSSHVMEFGQLSIGRLPLSEFQGPGINRRSMHRSRVNIEDAVPSPDVPLLMAKRRMEAQSTAGGRLVFRRKYERMLAARHFLTQSMWNMINGIKQLIGGAGFEQLWSGRRSISRHACYEQLYEHFDRHCFRLAKHPFALRFLYLFVNICESGDSWREVNLQAIKANMFTHCNGTLLHERRFKRIY